LHHIWPSSQLREASWLLMKGSFSTVWPALLPLTTPTRPRADFGVELKGQRSFFSLSVFYMCRCLSLKLDSKRRAWGRQARLPRELRLLAPPGLFNRWRVQCVREVESVCQRGRERVYCVRREREGEREGRGGLRRATALTERSTPN